MKRLCMKLTTLAATFVLATATFAMDRPSTQDTALRDAENLAYQAWLVDYYTWLERSSNPALRVASAEYWFTFGKDEARTAALLDSVASNPERSTGDTWVIANHCARGHAWLVCERGDWIQEVIDSDPDNAAPFLLAINQPQLSGDSSPETVQIRAKLLKKAANAARFDDYWAYSAYPQFRAALEFMNSQQVPLGSFKGTPEQFALNVIITNMGVNIYPMSGRINLCSEPEHRETCRKLALLAIEQSHTWVSRHMGLSLFQVMDQWTESDRLAIRHEFADFMSCPGTQILFGPYLSNRMAGAEYERLAKEFSEFGEVEAYRRASIRAYRNHPDAFTLDPSTCSLDTVLGMIDVLAQQP